MNAWGELICYGCIGMVIVFITLFYLSGKLTPREELETDDVDWL